MSDDLPDEFDLVVIGTGKNSGLLCDIFMMTHLTQLYKASRSPALLLLPVELAKRCFILTPMSTTATFGAHLV